MTPAALSALHKRAFAPTPGWEPDAFAGLLTSRHVHLYVVPHGFALLQVAADEAEVLTLAVDPAERGRGVGDRLMRSWMQNVDAQTAYLEVAADNAAAIALYTRHGFVEGGRRKGYYARQTGAPVDALLMQAALTSRSSGELPVGT